MTRPKSTSLTDKLDEAAIALLDKTYGDIMDGTIRDVDPDAKPDDATGRLKPDVFNAIVNWVRVKNKLEPDDSAPSELDKIAEKMNAGRKR